MDDVQFLVSSDTSAIDGLAAFLRTLYEGLLKAGLPDSLVQVIITQTANTFITKSLEVKIQDATTKK